MRVTITSLFFTYLFIVTNSTTDIASINCPNDFNVTVANVTTGIGNGQLASFFFSPFMNSDTKAKVQDIIIGADKDGFDSYVTGTLMIPYIAIGAAFFVTFLIIICCTVFEKSCPPCHSWRRDFLKRPY